MAWAYLILAGILEMGFTVSLKLSEGFSQLPFVLTFALSAGLSLFFLNKSLQGIDIGTAYAVWTGIGSLGTAVIGILFFRESASLPRLFFLALLICSIVGLKLVSPAASR